MSEAVRSLDAHDDAVYREAFVMAEAVRRFLVRNRTQRVIDAGLLDEDVVRDLVESSDRMWLIRTQRVGAARAEVPEPPCSTCGGSGKRYPHLATFDDPCPDCREVSP